MQSQWVKRYLSQTLKKRRKLNLKKSTKIRKRVATKKKPDLTKRQVVKILKQNNVKTLRQLVKFNNHNPNRITLTVIKKLFGSWLNCKRQMGQQWYEQYTYDEEKVIIMLADLKIMTLKQFKQAHKKQPKLIPGMRWLLKHFSKWSNLKRVVRSQMLQDILKRFMDLKFQLKRYPTKKQCYERSIQLDVVQQHLTYRQIRQFIEQLEKYYVQKTRRKNY